MCHIWLTEPKLAIMSPERDTQMAGWSFNEWMVFVTVGLVALIGAIATAAVKIIGALQGVGIKVDAVETSVAAVKGDVNLLEGKVDGRLTQLLERTAVASRAEGVDAGRGEVVVPISVPAQTVFLPSTPELPPELPPEQKKTKEEKR